MGGPMEPDDRVSRRLKMSDLRMLLAVVQWGSMSKAAAYLNISQSAVSKALGELEHPLGVRLLDRSPQGIEPTVPLVQPRFDAMFEQAVADASKQEPTALTVEVPRYTVSDVNPSYLGSLRRFSEDRPYLSVSYCDVTDEGFVDTALLYGQSVYGPFGSGIADQLSALPSVHVGWALLIAFVVITVSTSRWRWLIVAHPVVTILVVVATANHFWADGIAAALILGGAVAGATALEGRRRRRAPAVPELVEAPATV